MEGVKGWLLVYVIGSVPLMMFYSIGLSGFFFDYPVSLTILIFVFLAIPLLLILMKSPQAPRWNIAELWILVVLMTLRSAGVFLFPLESEELPGIIATLSGIVAFSIGWAIVWTKYFRESVRVRNTFS